jgi:hypothetical protein
MTPLDAKIRVEGEYANEENWSRAQPYNILNLWTLLLDGTLASDQSKVYLEGTLGRRWNPLGEQPLVADGARQKRAESLYGAVHLGTGAEVAPCAIDWQDSAATIRWYELLLEACPHGQLLLWQDQAPHHTRH